MKYRQFFWLPVLALLCGAVQAQQSQTDERETAYFETGLGYQQWKVQPNYEPMTQLSMPFKLVFPMGQRMMVNIANTPAVSWWTEDRRITGLSDTWIQANYEIKRDRLVLNAGIGLPTGKTKLDTNQYDFSKAILRRNIFKYTLPLYGQGLNLKMGLMSAIPVGKNVVIGFGAQYITHSAYQPVIYDYTYVGLNGQNEDGHFDADYKVGDEFTAQFGVDFMPVEKLRIAVDALYTYYWRDLLNDKEVYGAGGKFSMNLDAMYRFGLERYVWTHMVYRQHGKNELLQGVSLQPEVVNSNGSQFEMDVEANVMSDEFNGIHFLTSFRYYGKAKTDNALTQQVLGLGVGSRLKTSDRMMFKIRFKYLFGSIKSDLASSKILGLETFISMLYTF